MMQDKPLMSLLVFAHNFEHYVEDALRGAFNQTYDNLEIVVSDDCSTDGTWDVIMRVVDEYRRVDNKFDVIMNRNSENMGIVPHFEKAKSLCHGELIFCNDGDDISLPTRVEDTVAAWEAAGRKPWVMFSGAYKISLSGRIIGEVVEYPENESTLGLAAYRRGIEDVLGFATSKLASQDEVYGCRSLILGPRGSVCKPLVKYRIGSGESSGFYDYRRRRLRILSTRAVGSMDQLLKDLDVVKGRIDSKKWDYWKRRLLDKKDVSEQMIKLFGSDSFSDRLAAFRAIRNPVSPFQRLLYLIMLLPHSFADFLLNMMSRMIDVKCWGMGFWNYYIRKKR